MKGRSNALNYRGQTSQVGVILIVGVVIIGIFSIIGFGITGLDGTTSGVSDETAERDLVTLAEAIDQEAINQDTGAGTRDSEFNIREIFPSTASLRAIDSAGSLTIQVNGTTVFDDNLGVIEYEDSDVETQIAYQAGMVFTKQNSEPAAIRRANQFQYRDGGPGTGITMHVLSISESTSMGDEAAISVRNATNLWPTIAIPSGTLIEITVTSEYHNAWERKFDQMFPDSRSSIAHDPPNNEVTTTYVAPTEGTFLHLFSYELTVK